MKMRSSKNTAWIGWRLLTAAFGLIPAVQLGFASEPTSSAALAMAANQAHPAAAESAATTGQLSALANKTKFYIGSDARDIVVAHWTKTFRGGSAPDYISGHGEAPTETGSSKTADLLNSIFQDVYVEAAGETLIIIGPKDRVRQIKVMLARWLDVPYPTVTSMFLASRPQLRTTAPKKSPTPWSLPRQEFY